MHLSAIGRCDRIGSGAHIARSTRVDVARRHDQTCIGAFIAHVGIKCLHNDTLNLAALSFALNDHSGRRTGQGILIPQTDVDAPVIAAGSKFHIIAIALKPLGGQSLELPPVDVLEALRLASQIIDEPLIEILLAVGREFLAGEERIQGDHVGLRYFAGEKGIEGG